MAEYDCSSTGYGRTSASASIVGIAAVASASVASADMRRRRFGIAEVVLPRSSMVFD